MSTCPICKGSGETGSYGVLDCTAPNCTAAVERLALEEAASTASLTDYDARWMAYGLGKAAALEQAKHDAFLAKVEEIVNNGVKTPLAGPFIKPAILG